MVRWCGKVSRIAPRDRPLDHPLGRTRWDVWAEGVSQGRAGF
jgi:hypothetical protein